MFANEMRGAIDAARTLTQLDELSKTLWQAWGGAAIDQTQAEELSGFLEMRRKIMRGEIKPVGIPLGRSSIFPPRKAQITPDRAKSRTRRRELAAAGPMPPKLATMFTQGELAVMAIIGEEVRSRGLCDRTVAELAARAGVGRTTAQNAVRAAASRGLITIQERRRQGQKNLPNVVRIVSREWIDWLAKRPKRLRDSFELIGFKNSNPTDNRSKNLPLESPVKPKGHSEKGRAAERASVIS